MTEVKTSETLIREIIDTEEELKRLAAKCKALKEELGTVDPYASKVQGKDWTERWVSGAILGKSTKDIGLSDATLAAFERARRSVYYSSNQYMLVHELVVRDPMRLLSYVKGAIAARKDIAQALLRLGIKPGSWTTSN